MAEPIVMVLRFEGESERLAERFEAARRSFMHERGPSATAPIFYALAKTSDGIAALLAWSDADAHKAFASGMRSHLKDAGIRPVAHEHLPVAKLGWD